MKQRLLWIPEGVDVGAFAKRCPPVPLDGPLPDRVWTLYTQTDQLAIPVLPITPVHRAGAFLEDHIHDWNVDHKGNFRYASRICDGGVWLLLENKS